MRMKIVILILVSYDTTEKCLYASDHVHSWSYSTSADKIIATCTAKPDCEFNPGKLDLTLAAADAYYSGNTYTGATVTNGIAYQSGDEARYRILSERRHEDQQQQQRCCE